MKLLIGLIFVVVAALVFLLVFLLRPPAPKKKGLAKKKEKIARVKPVEPPQFTQLSDGRVIVPPEIPRTIGTIKIIAEEHTMLVVNVVKRWLKEKPGSKGPMQRKLTSKGSLNFKKQENK